MDSSIQKLLHWESYSGEYERAVVDIPVHKDRKYFWNYWHVNKDFLKQSGYYMKKESDGNFYLYKRLEESSIEKERVRLKTLELSKSSSLDTDIYVPSPEGLNYFGYQKAAIHFANQRKATLIGDEMGSGKSIMTAGIINSNEEFKSILVICPSSLRLNWKRELEKWLVNSYDVGIVNRSDYPVEADIVIINFDVVHKHHEKLTEKVWDLLVIDEVHFLKSKSARRSKYVFGNKKSRIEPIQANKKIFLSGTPIVNKPIELFPIIQALDPDTWSSQWSYAHRYCDAKHNGWGWDFTGASNLDELQDKLRSTIMIRRLKKDILPELPPKFRQIIELPNTEKTQKLIQQEMSEWERNEEVLSQLRTSMALAKINEDKDGYRDSVNKLKEGVTARFSAIAKLREVVALAKLPYVIEHLRDIEDKVVVFAHHKSVIKKLKEAFGDEAVMLVGDTKMADRQKAVDEFQKNPEIKYFLGSITAAGVGITLTASSHVVFAELDWVPGNVSQCEDRSHRLGAVNNVLVQHLVLEGSLDAKIAKTLIQKQEVIDKALDEEYSLENEAPVYEEVILPTEKEFLEESSHISPEEKASLLEDLKILASYDSDKARIQNGLGFSKTDSSIGHSLASFSVLSDRQAVVAKRLVNKYRRQLVS